MGCGRVVPKTDLLRLACADRAGERGEGARPALVRVDLACRLPGRGAYLCREDGGEVPREGCLSRALARKAFPRAFRRAVEVPVELVESVGP